MEDRLASLYGRDPASGKRLPVPDAVHLVENRDLRIPGTEKIGVKGVHRTPGPGAIVNCPPRRDQRLSRDLPTEDAQPVLRRADAAVEVYLQRFEIEKVQEFVEGCGHPSIMACALRGPPSSSLPDVATSLLGPVGEASGARRAASSIGIRWRR